MSRTRCTVIILNWNGKQYLEACLGSLRRQTLHDFETLLVDNGSQDGSATYVAKEFAEVRVISLKDNLGYCRSNNIGIEHSLARGSEFVLLLNNDTTIAPDCLERMLSAMDDDPTVAIVCPKIFFAAEPDTLWYAGSDFSLWTARSHYAGWRQKDQRQYDQRRSITQATGCAMLARTSAVVEVGLLDERLWAYVEDLDWSIRFLRKGYRVLYEPQARVWHHDGGTAVASGSQYRRQYLTTRNLLLLCREHVRWWQLPTFLIGFLSCHVAYYSLLRVATGDFRALSAIYKGVVDSMQSNSSSPNTQMLKVGASTRR